uniref:DUF223 domain-containing protein n=1 Tax=Oryza rufipogon TaxID=4529 RepID=A0A0E0N4W5_ORYRU
MGVRRRRGWLRLLLHYAESPMRTRGALLDWCLSHITSCFGGREGGIFASLSYFSLRLRAPIGVSPTHRIFFWGEGGGHLCLRQLMLTKMDYTILRNVTQESHHWQVRVRVTRFSQFTTANEPDKILRLDLVLLDEQYFEVAEARPQYRPIDRMVMAKFIAHTTVREDTEAPFTFPSHAYKVLSFDELRGRAYSKDILSVKLLSLHCGVPMLHSSTLKTYSSNQTMDLFLHGNPQVVRAIEPNFGQKEAVHVKVFDICDLNPHEALTNHDAKTAEFTFFGEIGYQLIGIPVLNLVASVQGARDIVPSEIKAVFGKQYVIRTSVSRGSLQRTRISYQVDSLMLASPDAAHTGTLPSHDASVASSQHGSSPADAIEPHTIIGSSLQSMTPSTPLVLPDPKVLAMAQPDKKHKSSVIDEDLAQEGSSPREHDCQKASVVRALFVDKLPPQPPKCK